MKDKQKKQIEHTEIRVKKDKEVHIKASINNE
jgi:hypothetical protein